jgi:hypothetical protein
MFRKSGIGSALSVFNDFCSCGRLNPIASTAPYRDLEDAKEGERESAGPMQNNSSSAGHIGKLRHVINKPD